MISLISTFLLLSLVTASSGFSAILDIGYHFSSKESRIDHALEFSMVMLDASGKLPLDEYWVSWNNLYSVDGAARLDKHIRLHSGAKAVDPASRLQASLKLDDGNPDEAEEFAVVDRSSLPRTTFTSDKYKGSFVVDTNKIDKRIKKLVIMVSAFDENETVTLDDLQSLGLSIKLDGSKLPPYVYPITEKKKGTQSILLLEIELDPLSLDIKEDQECVDLPTILEKRFGADLGSEPEPEIIEESMPKMGIDLEKKLEENPEIKSLFLEAKKCTINLAKKKQIGLDKMIADVVLILDISGSMDSLYKNGSVQHLINRALGVGCALDDDGKIPLYPFAGRLGNVRDVVLGKHSTVAKKLLDKGLGGSTSYAPPIAHVRRTYFPDLVTTETQTTNNWFFGKKTKKVERIKARNSIATREKAVVALFITDGEAYDKEQAKLQVLQSSWEPVFWSFLALANISKPRSSAEIKERAILRDEEISGSSFSFLQDLDDMKKPKLDNVDFFAIATWAVKNTEIVSDAQFYQEMLPELPGWINDAHIQGMIRR